jgi:hypothetical protein
MNLETCHRCPNLTGLPYAVCAADDARRRVTVLARAGTCPIEKFTTPDAPRERHEPHPPCPDQDILREIDKRPEGLGDTIKAMIDAMGADKAAALFRQLMGMKNCKCEERRAWLNKWWPYK